MLISVIVPFWNSEKWLDRCLNSLHQQSGDLEFVIVDDNSTDCGCKIAENYVKTDKRFQLFKNEHSKGVSGARNTGIDHATGEFITFLDADDEFNAEAAKTLLRAAESKERIIQLNHLRHYAKIGKTTLKYANKEGIYGIFDLPDCWWGVWNKLYMADFIKENGIRFKEGLSYGEDGLFNLECLAVDPVIYHAPKKETAVIHHFDNAESLSHVKTSGSLIFQIRAYEDFLFRQTDTKMRQLMCDLIAELWQSPRAKELIGRYE